LIQAGAPEIRILNRTRERGIDLVRGFKKSGTFAGTTLLTVDWKEAAKALAAANLLVNASAAGQDGENDLDIPLDLLPHEAVVNDIVYAPLETGLLKDARARGYKTVDGLGMLLHQARPGFAAGSRRKWMPICGSTF
jgi:shikimate dehydrogenase